MKFIISKTALEMAVKNICRVINPIDPLYQGEEITMLLMPMLVNDD
jgi:hypothetical protein